MPEYKLTGQIQSPPGFNTSNRKEPSTNNYCGNSHATFQKGQINGLHAFWMISETTKIGLRTVQYIIKPGSGDD